MTDRREEELRQSGDSHFIDPSCELCPPVEQRTKWHYEDDLIVVFDCDTCRPPIKPAQYQVVSFKFHDEPTAEEWDYAKAKALELFPGSYLRMWRSGGLAFDEKVMEHPHFHVQR